MRKIILLFLVLGMLLFSGCSDDAITGGAVMTSYVCSDGTVVVDASKCKSEDSGEEEGVYNMKEGESVSVEGGKVTVNKINADGSYSVDVGGVSREIKQTKYTEIVNGLKIRSLKMNFDYTDNSNSFIELEIEKFVPGSDEYLFFMDVPQTLYGESITLTNVEASDSSIKVKVSDGDDARVREGYSETVGNLEIENVDTFPRDVRRENYAVLKVVKK